MEHKKLKKTLLFLCSDVVGTKMGGVGIRYWELAKSLVNQYDVILVTPNQVDLKHEKIKIISLVDHSLSSLIPKADVVITQNITHKIYSVASKNNVRLIADLYDPIVLEYLESSRCDDDVSRDNNYAYLSSQHNLNFQLADGYICANDEQKKLWIGFMLSLQLIPPRIYDKDPNLNHFLGIVPIGMSNEQPKYVGEGLRKKFGFAENDHIVLWGGGIWNWFDPLTLIKAIHQISLKRNDIKLVFMGIKHPNDAIPEMKMSISAIELAKELGVLDKFVFFNYGWVSYEERQSYLLDSKIGVCCHENHLETMFSFRTRVLDYFWTQLPIITSEGDSFARHVRENNLGRVVAENDVTGWTNSILELINNPTAYQQCRDNIKSFAVQFTWDEAAKNLVNSVEFVQTLPRKRFSILQKISFKWNLAKAYVMKFTYRNISRKLRKIYKQRFANQMQVPV